MFRHGQTDWNVQERMQGQVDTPLNMTGICQAQELAEKLKNVPLEIIYSSDLERARDTATKVSSKMRLEILHTDFLRENSFGEAEGLLYTEVKEKFGLELWENYRSMSDAHYSVGFPGGETKEQSVTRVLNLFKKIISEGKYAQIGISTHGGIIRNLINYLRGFNSNTIPIPNCCVYKISYHLKADESEEWQVTGPIGSSLP